MELTFAIYMITAKIQNHPICLSLLLIHQFATINSIIIKSMSSLNYNPKQPSTMYTQSMAIKEFLFSQIFSLKDNVSSDKYQMEKMIESFENTTLMTELKLRISL